MKMNYAPHILECLFRVMEAKEMTIVDMAKKLNCGRNTLSRYRRGWSFPSLEFFVSMLDALDLKIVIRPKSEK